MAKAAVAIRNIAQKFGFVEQARSASTPEDHSQVVDRVEAELTDAKMRLVDLENRRETVVLEGGDIHTFHGELANAREVVETLQATYREAIRRHEEAKANRYSRDLEAGVRALLDDQVPAAEEAHRQVYRLAVALADATERANKLSADIRNSDENSKNHDRPDLVIDHRALRARIAAEMANDVSNEAPPVRYGMGGDPEFERGRALYYSTTVAEQKQFQIWQRQNPQWAGVRFEQHETNEAFQRRVLAWTSRNESAQRREDPFKQAGERAIGALEVFLRAEGAYEASRGVRRVEQSTYVHPDGQVIQKVRPIDGFGKGTFAPPKSVAMK